MHKYASQAILPGPEEDPRLAHISPSKRGAMALEGSPMFAPLEVKYKNLSKFQDIVKRNQSGRKYATIDAKPEPLYQQQPELEE